MRKEEIRKGLRLLTFDGRIWNLVVNRDEREQVLCIYLKPKGPWNKDACMYFYGRLSITEENYFLLLKGERQAIKRYVALVEETIQNLVTYILNYYSSLDDIEIWTGKFDGKEEM